MIYSELSALFEKKENLGDAPQNISLVVQVFLFTIRCSTWVFQIDLKKCLTHICVCTIFLLMNILRRYGIFYKSHESVI
jgi:hypothetical protein